MGERRIGVIINGATGRMGTTQHMANLLAIASEGGLPLANGDRLIPELMLVGRDVRRIEKLAAEHGGQRRTTRSSRRRSPGPDRIFMDCAATGDRPRRLQDDRHRQAHLHREADGAHGRRGDGPGAAGRPGRPQARRHPGQALPAGLP